MEPHAAGHSVAWRPRAADSEVPQPVPVLRFLQISDLHLGAPLAWLPPAQRAERRREQRRALEVAIDAAIERGVQAILVPGDLFDAEGADAETLAFAVHAFDRPGCPPVFIAPGNHDPGAATSTAWNPRLLAARGWAWPRHVHVFQAATWTPAPLADAPITVWGRSFTSQAPAFERPLSPASMSALGALDPGRIHVAVFHGSRESACPPGQKITAPFSDEEALAAPFAYLAVGHYHRPSRLGTPREGVKLAYAGSAVALAISETGEHGALLVTLDPDARRGADLEAIALDPRQVRTVDVDVAGASCVDEIERLVVTALEQAGVSDRDIVRVRLAGRLVRGVRYEGASPDLQARVFALRLEAHDVRPDYDLEGIRAREPSTTEDRFAHALLAELDGATDPDQRRLILAALYYGLDAFRLRDVAPAYEELRVPVEEVEA